MQRQGWTDGLEPKKREESGAVALIAVKLSGLVGWPTTEALE